MTSIPGPSMWASIRPYWLIVAVYSRADLANPVRLTIAIAIQVIRVIFIAAIYRVAYRGSAGTSLPYANAVWSVAAYFAFIMNLGLRNIFSVVNNDVKSGVVEVALTKPLDWRLTKVAILIGSNGREFLLQLVVLPVALLFLVGPPDLAHLTPLVDLVFVVLLFLAIITASAMFLTIGLSAFWLTDAQPVYRILDKVALIFGGGFVPIALLPAAAQSFVRYSPFGVYAAPTQVFNPGIVPHLPLTLLSAVLWSIALIMLCQWVWHRAQSRIEVNGG
jgi:ABC-type uncharacterized transport system permease subunit